MAQLINGVNYIVLKIGDFGLAVQMEGKDKPDNYMIPNTRAGTPSYIAP